MFKNLLAVFSDPRAIKYLLKTIAKSFLDGYQQVKVGLLRFLGVVDFPVPPNSRRRGTSSLTIRHYYESGLTTALPIATAAFAEGYITLARYSISDAASGGRYCR